MNRILALSLAIVLVLGLSAVALADDPPAVVYIDPVDGDNRVDVSRAGEEIDITGYVEYVSETFSHPSGSYTVPVLRQLRFFVDGVEDEDQFKNWPAANPVLSIYLPSRDATGYEFLFQLGSAR